MRKKNVRRSFRTRLRYYSLIAPPLKPIDLNSNPQDSWSLDFWVEDNGRVRITATDNLSASLGNSPLNFYMCDWTEEKPLSSIVIWESQNHYDAMRMNDLPPDPPTLYHSIEEARQIWMTLALAGWKQGGTPYEEALKMSKNRLQRS